MNHCIELTAAICQTVPESGPRHPNPKSIAERFWALVHKGGECWTWAGATNNRGYGKLNGGPALRFAVVLAHRVSFAIHNGWTPGELEVCHRCDNPSCVNPDHLFIGTHTENLHDARRKGRIVREENHPRAKLTKRKVTAIRKAIGGGMPRKSIAVEYGVSESTIGDIAQGRTWRGPR